MTTNTQILYGVRNFTDREGEDRSQWTRIGTAFQNQDGSWNLRFDYLPTDRTATVQMRPVKSGEEGAEGGAKPAAGSDR